MEHRSGVIRALERNKWKQRQDMKQESRGIVRPPKRKCLIRLTGKERQLYTHCLLCGLPTHRHP